MSALERDAAALSLRDASHDSDMNALRDAHVAEVADLRQRLANVKDEAAAALQESRDKAEREEESRDQERSEFVARQEALERTIKEIKAECDVIRGENDVIKSERDSLLVERDSLKAEIETLKDAIHVADGRSEAMSIEVVNLGTDIEELRNEKRQLERRLAQSAKDLRKHIGAAAEKEKSRDVARDASRDKLLTEGKREGAKDHHETTQGSRDSLSRLSRDIVSRVSRDSSHSALYDEDEEDPIDERDASALAKRVRALVRQRAALRAEYENAAADLAVMREDNSAKSRIIQEYLARERSGTMGARIGRRERRESDDWMENIGIVC